MVNKLSAGFVGCAFAVVVVQLQFHVHRFTGSQLPSVLVPFAGFAAGTLIAYRRRTGKERNRQLVRHGYGQASPGYPPWPPPQTPAGGPQTAG